MKQSSRWAISFSDHFWQCASRIFICAFNSWKELQGKAFRNDMAKRASVRHAGGLQEGSKSPPQHLSLGEWRRSGRGINGAALCRRHLAGPWLLRADPWLLRAGSWLLGAGSWLPTGSAEGRGPAWGWHQHSAPHLRRSGGWSPPRRRRRWPCWARCCPPRPAEVAGGSPRPARWRTCRTCGSTTTRRSATQPSLAPRPPPQPLAAAPAPAPGGAGDSQPARLPCCREAAFLRQQQRKIPSLTPNPVLRRLLTLRGTLFWGDI